MFPAIAVVGERRVKNWSATQRANSSIASRARKIPAGNGRDFLWTRVADREPGRALSSSGSPSDNASRKGSEPDGAPCSHRSRNRPGRRHRSADHPSRDGPIRHDASRHRDANHRRASRHHRRSGASFAPMRRSTSWPCRRSPRPLRIVQVQVCVTWLPPHRGAGGFMRAKLHVGLWRLFR